MFKLNKQNHARSKQKRKNLKQKAFALKVFLSRAKKQLSSGAEISASALIGINMLNARQTFDVRNTAKRRGPWKERNQRQKRKLAAQVR